MKKLSVLFIVVLSGSVFAQREFRLNDASKYFDVKVNVEKCDESYCTGTTKFSFYKKGRTIPYQVIEMKDTQLELGEDGKAMANVTMLYDHQSVVNIGDFNFDGMEDIAICDGPNGSYGGPSYSVYLSSKAAGKFVYSKAFTELGQHLGMFEVDKAKKRLTTLDKSGCCYHITEEFIVRGNKPFKVRSVEEELGPSENAKVRITTKTLVSGKWKTSVRYVKQVD